MADSPSGLTLVVSLHAHVGQEAGLHEFERQAIAILRQHGGRLEKVVRVDAGLGGGPVPSEVHVVWFPSEAAFAAYRADPRLVDLAPLRAQAIASTTILIGHAAEPYE
jgi:hypothetical protein